MGESDISRQNKGALRKSPRSSSGITRSRSPSRRLGPIHAPCWPTREAPAWVSLRRLRGRSALSSGPANGMCASTETARACIRRRRDQRQSEGRAAAPGSTPRPLHPFRQTAGSLPVHSAASSVQSGLKPLVFEMVMVHSHLRSSVLRARTVYPCWVTPVMRRPTPGEVA